MHSAHIVGGVEKFKPLYEYAHYTCQQQKYTLSETNQTLLILGRWFQIWHPFFLSRPNFAVLPDCRFYGRLLAFRIFFFKFWNFKNLFFHMKRQQNCQWFAKKKMSEIGQMVPEKLYFKVKKSSKISDFSSNFILFSS